MAFWPGLRKRKTLALRIAPNLLSGNEALALEPGSTDHNYAHTWSGPVVLIRDERVQGQIINGWLVLIVVLGAVIAVADGLTRAPNPELELSPPQPLAYEPYRAAFLLAGLTLPLMFAYAKRACASLTEGLFLWFVFCTTAYTKDFSYLRWPGIPLFVTDIVLTVLLVSIYIVPRRRGTPYPLLLNIFLALFIAAGALAAARGFLGHRDTILVLRDSALVGYSLFLLVGYHLLRSWLAIRRVAVCQAPRRLDFRRDLLSWLFAR